MSEKNELMEIVRQTAFNVAGVSEQMGILSSSVKELKIDVTRTREELSAFKEQTDNRMQNYESRIRVDHNQAQNIKNTIHSRVADLLDIHYVDGIIKDEIALYNDKYYRGGFISRCYVDARKQSRLGTPYYETLIRDYDEVLDFINNWTPPTGVEGYKQYLDTRRMK